MDTTLYSFLDGAIIGGDTFAFAGIDDARSANDDDHGIVWKYKQGVWHSIEIAERLVSCAATQHPDYRFVAIAESGRELVIGDHSLSQELVGDHQHSPENNGSLIRVCAAADQHLYAVGAGRQVYKKASTGRWVRIDQGCYVSIDDEPKAVFTDLVSLADASLCAVGWDGEIWLGRDRQWVEVVSPTNVALLCAAVASDGWVCVAGASGIVLRGRDDCWHVLENSETFEDITSIAEFKNVMYLGSASGLFRIQDNTVVPALTGAPMASVLKLSASSKQLLAVSEKVACVFDGKNWTTLQ